MQNCHMRWRYYRISMEAILEAKINSFLFQGVVLSSFGESVISCWKRFMFVGRVKITVGIQKYCECPVTKSFVSLALIMLFCNGACTLCSLFGNKPLCPSGAIPMIYFAVLIIITRPRPAISRLATRSFSRRTEF